MNDIKNVNKFYKVIDDEIGFEIKTEDQSKFVALEDFKKVASKKAFEKLNKQLETNKFNIAHKNINLDNLVNNSKCRKLRKSLKKKILSKSNFEKFLNKDNCFYFALKTICSHFHENQYRKKFKEMESDKQIEAANIKLNQYGKELVLIFRGYEVLEDYLLKCKKKSLLTFWETNGDSHAEAVENGSFMLEQQEFTLSLLGKYVNIEHFEIAIKEENFNEKKEKIIKRRNFM